MPAVEQMGCTAPRFGAHDYSQPPHSTPENPIPAEGDGCQSQSSQLAPCEHDRRYRVVIYQPGTHEWIVMSCCEPCTASLRMTGDRWGPGGAPGIHSVRSLSL